MNNAFGKLLKKLRMKKGLTLREFCQTNGIDPGNLEFPTKNERGVKDYADCSYSTGDW